MRRQLVSIDVLVDSNASLSCIPTRAKARKSSQVAKVCIDPSLDCCSQHGRLLLLFTAQHAIAMAHICDINVVCVAIDADSELARVATPTQEHLLRSCDFGCSVLLLLCMHSVGCVARVLFSRENSVAKASGWQKLLFSSSSRLLRAARSFHGRRRLHVQLARASLVARNSCEQRAMSVAAVKVYAFAAYTTFVSNSMTDWICANGIASLLHFGCVLFGASKQQQAVFF